MRPHVSLCFSQANCLLHALSDNRKFAASGLGAHVLVDATTYLVDV